MRDIGCCSGRDINYSQWPRISMGTLLNQDDWIAGGKKQTKQNKTKKKRSENCCLVCYNKRSNKWYLYTTTTILRWAKVITWSFVMFYSCDRPSRIHIQQMKWPTIHLEVEVIYTVAIVLNTFENLNEWVQKQWNELEI